MPIVRNNRLRWIINNGGGNQPPVMTGDLLLQAPSQDVIIYDAVPYIIDVSNPTHLDESEARVLQQTPMQGGGYYPGWDFAQGNGATRNPMDYMFGYIYTTDSTPGVSEEFPRGAGSRALCLYTSPPEFCSHYASVSGGGDWQAQPNVRVSGLDKIPNEFWVQYWMMIPRNPQQPSALYQRQKHLYFCYGDYPCQKLPVMGVRGFASDFTFWEGFRDGSNGPDYYLSHQSIDANLRVHVSASRGMHGDGSGARYTDPYDYLTMYGVYQPGWEQWYTTWGQNMRHGGDPYSLLPAMPFMEHNRWYLVKEHFDFRPSSASGRAQVNGIDQAAYEQWIRPRNGSFTKTAEWIGGVTPGFVWDLPNADDIGPIRNMELTSQTTDSSDIAAEFIAAYEAISGQPYTDGSMFNQTIAAQVRQNFAEKRWNYYQDFCISPTEAGLPVYGLAAE